MFEAILIQQPSVDFPAFLGACTKVLGYNPSNRSDATKRQIHEAERFLSCLSAIVDESAPVGLSPHLLTHVSFSMLVVTQERDMQDVLQYCSGMPFVITDTLARGMQVSVITGTLAQWRDAIISGCNTSVETVRGLFNKILGIFEAARLNVWTDCTKKQQGRTFSLEDHRGT